MLQERTTGSTATATPPATPSRNDPAQYDELVGTWWDRRGRFAMLHWIGEARARLVPPAGRPDALLVDLACGGGLMAPHVTRLGYRHVGVDLSGPSLRVAAAHGVRAVRADVAAVPLPDDCADVVLAGEVLEHVADPWRVLSEAVRLLRPGGTLVIDTIARTRWGTFSSVTVGERIPAGPPRYLHDPALFIDRRELVRRCARLGVPLVLSGLRPSLPGYLGWLLGRREGVTMVTTRVTSGLFQAHGVKEEAR